MESAAAAGTGASGRSALLLLLLSNLACGPAPIDALYRQAEQLVHRDEVSRALEIANDGFQREPSWRFRLLKAEILISARKAEDAIAVLAAPEASITSEQRARLAMHRGMAEVLLANYAAAEADLSRAQDLAKPLDLPLLDGEIELRRGGLRIRQGRLAEADVNLRDVLRIGEAQSDTYLQAAAGGNLGVMLMNSAHYEEAIFWLDRVRVDFEALHSRSGVFRALGNLGWCYHRLGDETKALNYLRQADAGFRALGNRYEQQIWLGNLSDLYFAQDDFVNAASAAKDALAIARELGDKYWIGWWLNNLALISINLHQFDAAELYNDEALKLFRENPGNQAGFYPRVNAARIAAGRKDFAKAEQLFRAVITASDDPVPILDAESGLAAMLIEHGETARASTEFQHAIALIERTRAALGRDESKLSYLSSLMHFYQEYVDFLVAQNKPEEALAAAEASRARVLEEKLHSGPARTAVRIAALKNLARSSHSALLSYWLAPEKSFLWIVTGDGVKLHVLPSEKQISPLIEAYRTFIENLRDPLASELPAGKKLAEILLGPVEAERIIVIPDRALHSLNLETLPDPKNPSHYLIDRMTVSIAPSLSVLAERAKPVRGEHSLLMIGDPEPAVEEYPRLPYASKEMELIQGNFPSDRRMILRGANAFPDAYRAADPSRFSWIHFAAHASANRESPLDSALILSRHESTYTLAARDVMNIPLHADLVTLSACRSAGSKTYSGEGLVGLSWAFLRAGARNVVAGLWDVTDLSTASLMADFYDELARNAAPPDALRTAKLRLLRSPGAYRKPFYWGPFQLYTGAM